MRTLVIESVVDAGSIAFFEGGRCIAASRPGTQVSRSEDLLPEISRSFLQIGKNIRELDEIIVAIGPGSYTGIRIGIATGRGLSDAIGCRFSGVSILSAIAAEFGGQDQNVVLLPMGKSDVSWQNFQIENGNISARSEPLWQLGDALGLIIEQNPDAYFISHPKVNWENGLKDKLGDRLFILENDINLASVIGTFAIRYDIRQEPKPIYLKNPRYIGVV